ncbi:unnamed protein product [Didymodactylos carnosus]|uniref:methylenetetrahydrofolate reductase (NADPH) n=1 Tax=Didymodactylos carnosus TaxID=1234261 RepID=A0A813PYF0_9BILA|nr:unnamed protein product [Didymodactylos carnosus]CAF0759826.1 unnamed protein product [Didymodactylos carnosus]CAF3497804.1 unnamed protein product [Didymodactylos carnosus]CAF3540560.1 unnamed protein product [Didymodactylos carnosus]
MKPEGGNIQTGNMYGNGIDIDGCNNSDNGQLDITLRSPVSPKGSCSLQSHQYVRLTDQIRKRISNNERWCSLEFFPPRTPSGAANLIGCFDRMAIGQPLFCDITWHPAGDPAGDKETSSMMIANTMLNYCGIDTMLHITCYGARKESMMEYLKKAKDFGIRNILALRGDPPLGEEWDPKKTDFRYGVDLVKFIRQHFQDYFVICVAGYPQGHPEGSYDDDLRYLKEKVECGADFVITQLFFKAETFLKFEADCRAIGIKCPIIPGIFPIQGYSSLRNIVRLAKLDVPKEIVECMEPIKDNDEAIRNFGVHACLQLCTSLLDSGIVNGLHFYTLNREYATIQVLKQLGLWMEEPPLRALPWKKTTANYTRSKENVRPIFWSIRPKSYVHRTSNWNEFPNGRWGLSSAPSFGVMTDYHLFYLKIDATKDELLEEWGRELTSEQDVWKMFACYIGGEKNQNNKIIKHFPWTDEELSLETKLIQNNLVEYNRRGILTINSQPAVNGSPSTDPVVGWDKSAKWICAYLEFFTSAKNIPALREVLRKFPSVNYHFVNKSGNDNEANADDEQPIAVTWGCFPGKEIIQPTVVDSISFMIWKDEAFGLWNERWAKLYEPETKSHEIIETVANNYYLVNLVDNDYVKGSCLWAVLDAMFEYQKSEENLTSSIVS